MQKFIVHTESSSGWGGQEMRILAESQGLIARGNRVVVLCTPGAPIFIEANRRGIEAISLPIGKKRLRGLFALFQWLDANRPDVVNTHSSTDSWLVALAVRVGKLPIALVRTRHVSVPVANTAQNRWLYRDAASQIVTTGEALRRELIARLGLAEDRVVSVPTGVDVGCFDLSKTRGRETMLQELNLPAEARIIGIVATLRSWKGHDILLKAFDQIAGRFPLVRLIIAGDGPCKQYLTQCIAALQHSDRVVMLGQRNDVPDLLSAFDIFALPSFANEGVPQALLQAMAMKLPVVSTPVGSITEIVEEGGSGFLVEPKNIDQLAERLSRLLEDSDMRASMGARGPQIVQRGYTEKAMLDAMDAIFSKSVAERAARRALRT